MMGWLEYDRSSQLLDIDSCIVAMARVIMDRATPASSFLPTGILSEKRGNGGCFRSFGLSDCDVVKKDSGINVHSPCTISVLLRFLK